MDRPLWRRGTVGSIGPAAILTVFVALAATLMASVALAGPTSAEKCTATKLIAAGKYALCRLKVDAKVAKKSWTILADYTKCDDKLSDGFSKAEDKFSCEITGDMDAVEGLLTKASDSVSTIPSGLVSLCDANTTAWSPTNEVCSSSLVCGVGTVLEVMDGTCLPDFGAVCGNNTQLIGSACEGVPFADASACGTGTQFDTVLEQCIADLICGSGTTEQAGACVSVLSCGASTTQIGNVCEADAAPACTTFPSAQDCDPSNSKDCSCHDLTEADFIRADFSNGNLTNVRASDVDLYEANLDGITATDAILVDADLTQVSASGVANFSGATFAGAMVVDADFEDADLSHASLRRAWFDGSNFKNADLTGADLTNAILGESDFSNVTWSDTTCPDGTNSDNNGSTCCNSLIGADLSFPTPTICS